MRPFRYERAAGRGRRGRAARRGRPGATFLGGGTNLVDLMRLGVETPALLVDVTPPAARPDRASPRTAACASARRCATAIWPPTRSSASAIRSLAQARARRRVRPAAQPRDDRRQPAAAHPLRLLPGRDASPATSASPGSGCPAREGEHRNLAILGASEQCVATHPSDMAVALAALDAIVHVLGARRRARDPARRLPPPARATRPQRDTVLEPGELIVAVELPPLPVARALALPQGARACLLRVRARLGRGGARRGRTARSRDVRLALRRRGPQALAGARAPRTRCAARAATDESVRGAPPTPSWQHARPLRDNAYKVAARPQPARADAGGAGGVSVMPTPIASARRSTGSRAADKVTGEARLRRSSTSADGVAVRGARPVARSRAARSCAPSTRVGAGRCPACSPCSRTRTRRGCRAPTASWPCCSPPRVAYRGQIVAAVVAETLETARQARGARRASTTTPQPHDVELRADHPRPLHAATGSTRTSRPTRARATSTPALAAARGRRRRDLHDARTEHNNPMEPHATRRGLGRRRRPDPVRLEPGRVAVRRGGRGGVRARPGPRARDRAARRRRLRLEGDAAAARRARRDGRAGRSSGR